MSIGGLQLQINSSGPSKGPVINDKRGIAGENEKLDVKILPPPLMTVQLYMTPPCNHKIHTLHNLKFLYMPTHMYCNLYILYYSIYQD